MLTGEEVKAHYWPEYGRKISVREDATISFSCAPGVTAASSAQWAIAAGPQPLAATSVAAASQPAAQSPRTVNARSSRSKAHASKHYPNLHGRCAERD